HLPAEARGHLLVGPGAMGAVVAHGFLLGRRATHLPMRSHEGTTRTSRPTVLVVGSGFAGFHCMRRLEKHLPPDAAELLLASSADYLLYSPLLPNVAAGGVDPRHIAVGLHAALRRAKVLLGHVVAVDLQGRSATLRRADGSTSELAWDRLVLAPGAGRRTLHNPPGGRGAPAPR